MVGAAIVMVGQGSAEAVPITVGNSVAQSNYYMVQQRVRKYRRSTDPERRSRGDYQ